MAVGGGEQPERELGENKVRRVVQGRLTAGKQGQCLGNRRTAVRLVLLSWRAPGSLAQVLLGEAGDPDSFVGLETFLAARRRIGALPLPIETVYDEHSLVAERSDAGLCHRQVELVQETCA